MGEGFREMEWMKYFAGWMKIGGMKLIRNMNEIWKINWNRWMWIKVKENERNSNKIVWVNWINKKEWVKKIWFWVILNKFFE